MEAVVAARGDLAQVVAGREGAALGLDDHAADRLVLRQPVEFRLQRVYKLARERVERVRAVERQDGDPAVVAAQQDRFVGSVGMDAVLRGWARSVMPVMTPADLMRFLDDHFPQAADQGLAIEHLDDTTIRVRLPDDDGTCGPAAPSPVRP